MISTHGNMESQSASLPGNIQAQLAGEIDLAGFRGQARQLLAQQVPPEAVHWSAVAQNVDLFAQPQPASASRPRSVARAATAIVPASFLRLCESVVLHRDPQRFALLYRLLWRLVHEPSLRNDPSDPDMIHAQHMAHAVRRDIHKMKSYLKFTAQPTGPDDDDPLHVAWFEPTHHIVETVVPWIAKRQPGIRWAVLTPERSVQWNREQLTYGPGLASDRVPAAEADAAAWLACCEHVFKPAQ